MGLFTIFRKKNRKLEQPVDLSLVGVDIHSHLVPGIDDGSKSIEDSIQMIRELKELGYRKLITSPHIMGDHFRNTPEIIHSGLDEVKAELNEQQIDMQMGAIAEYYLDFDLERKMEEGRLMTFGSNYLLFEISYMNPPDNLNSMIFKLQTQGYKLVLAHPERYNFWHNDFNQYNALVDKGVLLQLNINSLTGYYSIPTKIVAQKMIEQNMITFLGTDCHHLGHINLMKQACHEPALERLIHSGSLLNNSL